MDVKAITGGHANASVLRLAGHLARSALDEGARFEVVLLAAQLSVLQGEGARAEDDLARLADGARDDNQRGLVAATRMENFARMGRVDEALAIAAAAEATIEAVEWRDEIAARRSVLVLVRDGPVAAIEVVEPLLSRAQGGGLVRASLVAGYGLIRVGRIEAALGVCERGYAVHLSLNAPVEWSPWFHLVLRCSALVQAGLLEAAEALALEQHDDALAEGTAEAQAWFAMTLAETCEAKGKIGTSARYARQAATLFRQLGRPDYEGQAWALLALAFALLGDATGAAEALHHIDGRGPFGSVQTFHDSEAQAWATPASGDLRGAEHTCCVRHHIRPALVIVSVRQAHCMASCVSAIPGTQRIAS